jgi:hypothetical protein
MKIKTATLFLFLCLTLYGCASNVPTGALATGKADVKNSQYPDESKGVPHSGGSYYNDFVNLLAAKVMPIETPSEDESQYYGQVGDFFGGVWGTLFGAATTLVVLATWISTKRIDARSKAYEIFAEILRTHEEIVGSWKIGNLTGRDALSVILSEFYEGYEEVQAMENEGLTQLSLREKIEAAFLLTYYGSHPETRKPLLSAVPNLDGSELCSRITLKKKSNRKKEILKKLSSIANGNKDERRQWHNFLRECFNIVVSYSSVLSEVHKHKLIEVLTEAKSRPYHKFHLETMHRLIEDYADATEFGGHQNRLSQYFRNLYSAFIFIDVQKLSIKEKKSLAKVLRSKLSNYEQALIALNSLTKQGADWDKSGLLKRYMPIKNIPEHFFSFDKNFSLVHEFSGVDFEWQLPVDKKFLFSVNRINLRRFLISLDRRLFIHKI